MRSATAIRPKMVVSICCLRIRAEGARSAHLLAEIGVGRADDEEHDRDRDEYGIIHGVAFGPKAPRGDT
jgi:hypothetical protein